jgi:ABC-2 type transport system permease protein
MRLYTYILKLQLLNALAYRFEYLSSIGRNLFFLLGSVFLWRTAYRGIDQVEGVSEAQMVTYAVVAVLMNACFTISIDNTLFGKVRAGEIALDLIRPVNLLWYWMTEDVGRSLAAVTQFAMPVLAISLFFVAPPLPVGGVQWLLFIPSCVLSFLLLWQLSALVGMTAFWVTDFGDVSTVKNSLVFALSGRLVPMWLFPDAVVQVSRWLPFQYTFQAPLEIYIGRIPVAEAGTILTVQAVWVAVLLLLLRVVWARAQRRVFVQGG